MWLGTLNKENKGFMFICWLVGLWCATASNGFFYAGIALLTRTLTRLFTTPSATCFTTATRSSLAIIRSCACRSATSECQILSSPCRRGTSARGRRLGQPAAAAPSLAPREGSSRGRGPAMSRPRKVRPGVAKKASSDDCFNLNLV